MLEDYGYTYDNANRLASKDENGTVTNYGYDNADQLTSDAGTGYSFDPNGNRTSGPEDVGALAARGDRRS